MRFVVFFIVGVLFLVGLFPRVLLAAQSSGGGYILNSQINQSPGVLTGNGYRVDQVSDANASVQTGNGFQTSPGIFQVLAPAPAAAPATSSNQGSGGGLSAPPPTVPEVADTTFSEMVDATPLNEAPARVDLSGDAQIDVVDFNVLMVNWGSVSGNSSSRGCSDKSSADINCDTKVNIIDFNLLMVYWGELVHAQ